MIDSYALNPAAMTFILPSSAKMGDTIQLIDATRVQTINNWIINPNGLSIAGSGAGNYTISSGDSLEFVYFESTRSTSLNAWIVYNRGKI